MDEPTMAAAPAHILIVEDEPSIRDTIQYPLESDGCTTHCCGTGEEAISALSKSEFDLVVLDVGLPDITGFEVCRRIREQSSVPVLFLTARSDEIDRVVGLELGGDDYVTKPFSPRELSARIRAILRRTRSAPSTESSAPPPAASVFAVDDERCTVRFHGELLDLSRTEFRLLSAFIARPGRVFSRAQLMDAAWDEPDASFDRTVDAHVKTLRAKLHALRPEEDPIVTHRGFGYSLAESVSQNS